MATFCSFINLGVPNRALMWWIFPFTPFPEMFSNLVTSSRLIFCSCALSNMACASGWVLFLFTEAAICRMSFSLNCAFPEITSDTEGLPAVMVPVLSTISTSAFSIFSKASEFFTRMPFFAPLPIPTMTDIGVASPNAHGQATISTAKRLVNAMAKLFGTPEMYHSTNVITAIPITAGTKIFEILSVSFWIGG